MANCKPTLSPGKQQPEQGQHAEGVAKKGGKNQKKKNKTSSAPSELGFPSKYENSFTQRGNRCPWLEFACGFILF